MAEDDDDDLLQHFLDNQVAPQIAAAKLRDQGLDVDVATVNVSEDAQGFEVTCVDCGRTARLPAALPEGKVAVCPRCLRARGMI